MQTATITSRSVTCPDDADGQAPGAQQTTTRIDKICVLSGSSINIPELFDALRVEQLVVALVGRSADKLETVRQFCERYARDLSQDATRVSATTDVDAGMSGARFVINMIYTQVFNH